MQVMDPARYGTPEVVGAPIRQVSTFDGLVGTEGGRRVMYTTNSGQPDAFFTVIDLEAYRVLRSFKLPGSPSAWAHVVTGDGAVYIGSTKGRLYRYTPGGGVEDLGQPVPPDYWIWALAADAEGNVYGGTFPGGRVFKYAGRTGVVRDYGQVAAGQQSVRSIAYHAGFVYTGVGTARAGLVRLDIETGERQEIDPPMDLPFDGSVYSLDVRGHYLFAFNQKPPALLVYDLDAGKWVGCFPGYRGLFVSDENDGKIYWSQSGKLVEFDLALGTAHETGIDLGFGLRHAGWVEVPDDPDLPGKSLATIQYGGQVVLINLQTGMVKTRDSILEGQPVPLQSLEMGPDGRLYISGYQGSVCASYDTTSGQLVNFPLGQVEGMGGLGTRMYFGVYPHAEIYSLDTTADNGGDAGNNAGTNAGGNAGNNGKPKPVKVHVVGDEQDRPFAVTSGDDKLFLGTISDYGKLGGALTIYDARIGTWATYRNVVQDHSIIGLVYRDGKLYGSTTVWGGLGAEPVATAAKVFVWDVASGEKIAEVVPEIPGIDVQPKAIGQLSFGPDGKLWAAAQGTIFVMDPDTLRVERARTIYPSEWNISHYWRPVYLRWGPDGLLYTTLRAQLTVIDPETLESLKLDDTALMTFGADGRLYYAKGAYLYRVSLCGGGGRRRLDSENSCGQEGSAFDRFSLICYSAGGKKEPGGAQVLG